jgi:GT2 family glycosyltransferase
MPNHALRIALIGEFSARENDNWCRAGIVQRQLARRLPDAEFTWFSKTALAWRDSTRGLIHGIDQLAEWFPNGPDAIVLAGGEVLRWASSPMSGGTQGDALLPPGTQLWLLPALLAAQWQIPLLWSALGVVGTIDDEKAPLVQLASELTAFRSVRDPLAMESLRQAGVVDPIALMPDPQVFLAEEQTSEQLSGTWIHLVKRAPNRELPTLCLNVREEMLGSGTDDLREAIRTLTGRHFARAILYSNLTMPGYRQVLESVSEEMGPAVLALGRAPSFRERLALAWGADAVVSGDMQDCLMALAFHKPHLAIGRDSRLGAYAALLGRRELAVRDSSSIPSAMECLMPHQMSILADRHEALCREASEQFDQMALLIEDRARLQRNAGKPAGQLQVAQATNGRGGQKAFAEFATRQWCEAAIDQHRERVRIENLQSSRRQSEGLAENYGTPWSVVARHARDGMKRLRIAFSMMLGMLQRGWPFALWMWHLANRRNSMARLMNRMLYLDPALARLSKMDLRVALGQYLSGEVAEFKLNFKRQSPRKWFRNYRPTAALLERMRARLWPDFAPRFCVVMRVHQGPAKALCETLESICRQTYSRWQLVAVLPREPLQADLQAVLQNPPSGISGRMIFVSEDSLSLDAASDYVVTVRQGDSLEPQALHRFAETILNEHSDLIYSDAVNTGEDLEDVQSVRARPAFSYDYFLAYGYIDDLVCVRASLLRQVGGFAGEEVGAASTEWVLRVLETGPRVSHIPDILYRCRHGQSIQQTPADDAWEGRRQAVQRHLERVGVEAEVLATDHPACSNISWRLHREFRTAIIIPTKDKVELLTQCIDSLEVTVPRHSIDVCVIDHQSQEAKTKAYLQEISRRHLVLPYQGAFNFSTLNNHAVARLNGPYDFYLFLNNDIEALSPGWLEHLLGIGQRAEVGAVGALLLYPDRTVQHAGCVVGMHYVADHAHKQAAVFAEGGRRQPGKDMALLACRDQSIVTGACLLVRADVFHQVGGFDCRYAVGFGDSDLCLRIKARGYKVILDTQAVLLHHESASRGKPANGDAHPKDTHQFRLHYLPMILNGDPCYSPLASRRFDQELNPFAVAKEEVRARTVQVVLPQLAAVATGSRPMRKAA